MAWKGINDNGGAVTVASDAETTICTITVPEGAQYLWSQIKLTTSDSSLNSFNTKIRVHPDSSDFYTIASSTSDYTTGRARPILKCSTDLSNLVSDTSGYLYMEVKALNAVRFSGTAAFSDGVATNIYWQVR